MATDMNFIESSASSAYELSTANRGVIYQNLVTYELIRPNINIGFGFDLRGDRPAIIGSVRKHSIADYVGLSEGDLVISINNKKVTDLDHDQVVRLVGLSKHKLILQVTKINFPKSTRNGNLINMNMHDNINALKIGKHSSSGNSSKKKTKKKLVKENLIYSKETLKNKYSNNTKTTEEDEEDSDYDFFVQTGRRRHNYKAGYYSNKNENKKKGVNVHVSEPNLIKMKNVNTQQNNALKKVPNLNVKEDDDDDDDDDEEDEYDQMYERCEMEEDEDYTEDTEDTEDTTEDCYSISNKHFSEQKYAQNVAKIPPPSLTSTFQLKYDQPLPSVNKTNFSIESSDNEVDYLNQKNGVHQYVNNNDIKRCYKLSYDQTDEVNMKPNSSNIAKIANIKHFNSEIMTNGSQSNLINNNSTGKQLNVNDLYAILKPVIKPHVYDAMSFYISKNQLHSSSFNVVYLANILIPYDTLSNASKLTSIRTLIESFLYRKISPQTNLSFADVYSSNNDLFKTSSSINLKVNMENIKLISIDNKSLSVEDVKCRIYNFSEIAFCGKIKDNRQFFALIILSNTKLSHCLIFRYLNSMNKNVPLEMLLNEIARIYRNQDFVFNHINPNDNSNFNDESSSISLNSTSDYLNMPLVDKNLNLAPTTTTKVNATNTMNGPASLGVHSPCSSSCSSSSLYVSNLNYEVINNISVSQPPDTSIKLMHMKSNEMLTINNFNKENFSVEFKCDEKKSEDFKSNVQNFDLASKRLHKDKLVSTASSSSSSTATITTSLITTRDTPKKVSKTNRHKLSPDLKEICKHSGGKNTNSNSSFQIDPIKSGLNSSELAVQLSCTSQTKQTENHLLFNDNEILKTIEIETNKNAQKNKQNFQQREQKTSDSRVTTNQSKNSIDFSTTNTAIVSGYSNSKFSLNSLNNRLSLKFSSSSSTKSKTKSSQPFQFLRSKPPLNPQGSTGTSLPLNSKENKISNSPKHEQFYDATQVLNSIESSSNKTEPSVEPEKLTDIRPQPASNNGTSRLSYPVLNLNSNTQSKSTAKRLLFNLLASVNNTNQKSSESSIKSKMPHLHQQRRLSDFHRPTKVSA
jgi:hypothetical protein